MTDHDPTDIPLPPPADTGPRCPWCSTPVPGPDAVTCGSCGATLHGDLEIEVPGVTAIDGQHAPRTPAPRKARRSLGSLFVSSDDAVPPPSEAELPALAMPDADVRREMLRLRLDAELADLTARVDALAAERGLPMPVVPGAERESEPAPAPDASAGPEAAVEPVAAREPAPEPETGAAPGQNGTQTAETTPRDDAGP